MDGHGRVGLPLGVLLMGVLGCPEEYEAIIVDSLTQQTIFHVPWSRITWSRVRNEVSTAGVTIAAADGGLGCCSQFGGLRGWSQMLRIERNGSVVWDGPITGWSRPSIANGGDGSVTIRAHDRFVLTYKRLVALDRTGLQDPGELFRNVLIDASFGTIGVDPYPFTVPALAEFTSLASSELDSSVVVARLERIYDVISQLVSQDAIYYSMIGGVLWVDETAVRVLLGGSGLRPALNEETTIDLPGIEVDCLAQSTIAYGGTLGTGKSGFPVVSAQAPYANEFLSCTLEVGQSFDRTSEVDPRWIGVYTSQLDVYTQVLAAQVATPQVTIEQVILSPDFGASQLEEDLSNLVPGAIIDIDYEDTCGFDVPYVGTALEYRYWWTEEILVDQFVDRYAWMPTPVSSASIVTARLERLDVEVGVAEGGAVAERITASLTPTAEWDGTLPAAWADPTPPYTGNRYLE